MSNITSAKPKPQAPQAAPDGNAIASLVLGILGITVLPFIGSVLALILGRASIGGAYERGQRSSTMATAGVILGWIGVAVPVVLFVFLFIFAGQAWMVIPAAFVILVLSALITSIPRNYRK